LPPLQIATGTANDVSSTDAWPYRKHINLVLMSHQKKNGPKPAGKAETSRIGTV
jgi:hypothetical protein